MYDTAEYANSRLAGTVITLLKPEKTLFYVHEVTYNEEDGSLLVGGWFPFEEFMLENFKQHPLDNFDLTTPLLGNVIVDSKPFDDCVYVTRIPLREDWRQGIRDRNLCIKLVREGLFRDVDIRFWKGLNKTLFEGYPSVEHILSNIKNKQTIPFSRKFSIYNDSDENKFLYYRTDVVGELHDLGVKLLNNFWHLKEQLEESSNGHLKYV